MSDDKTLKYLQEAYMGMSEGIEQDPDPLEYAEQKYFMSAENLKVFYSHFLSELKYLNHDGQRYKRLDNSDPQFVIDFVQTFVTAMERNGSRIIFDNEAKKMASQIIGKDWDSTIEENLSPEVE